MCRGVDFRCGNRGFRSGKRVRVAVLFFRNEVRGIEVGGIEGGDSGSNGLPPESKTSHAGVRIPASEDSSSRLKAAGLKVTAFDVNEGSDFGDQVFGNEVEVFAQDHAALANFSVQVGDDREHRVEIFIGDGCVIHDWILDYG